MSEHIGYKLKREPAELPCQSCGKLVTVMLPFYGCVFCSDCIKGESYETADSEEFKGKIIR